MTATATTTTTTTTTNASSVSLGPQKPTANQQGKWRWSSSTSNTEGVSPADSTGQESPAGRLKQQSAMSSPPVALQPLMGRDNKGEGVDWGEAGVGVGMRGGNPRVLGRVKGRSTGAGSGAENGARTEAGTTRSGAGVEEGEHAAVGVMNARPSLLGLSPNDKDLGRGTGAAAAAATAGGVRGSGGGIFFPTLAPRPLLDGPNVAE
ncbi:unnamed protein product, partial [Discosporangium mesarthrocarpum]